MPRFAANLSMMYQEHDFLDRFAAAAADGFRAVEYLFPYAFERDELAQPAGRQRPAAGAVQRAAGQLGRAASAAWPACPAARTNSGAVSPNWRCRMPQALHCPRIHVMAGLLPAGADRAAHRAAYLANLAWAAQQAASAGIDVLIEPINRRDIPGFFLNRQDDAHEVVAEVGAGNLKVQMDLYHCQIVEGDLAMKLRQYLPTGRVGHLQIAGVPQRHEPDLGEINHPYLFELIDELGFDGWIGCEYRPRAGTRDGLGWFAPYRATQPASERSSPRTTS